MRVYGIQHIGFTVPDLDQAVRFFETLFGAVTCLATGPLDVDDSFMRRRLGVKSGRRIVDIKVLRVGNGSNLELFQYDGEPDANQPLKENSQPGGFHLAFEVDDVMAAAARLSAAGLELMEGPTFIDAGPMSGLTWCYLKAPWGQFLEIVGMEGPLGAERAGGPPQWSPKTGQ